MFRVPHYGPGQSASMMQDPMSTMIMLFGMPILQQQLGGRDKFLPHLTPNQALMDQFMASQYQRANMNATLAASQAGQAAVSNRVAGLMSMMTGQPVTPLNREQSDNIAGVINNPVVKMVLGQMIGPDNLEAVMFGRHGDPSALAGAVGRTGFFRQDPMGGQRMTAKSLEEFTKSIHANLYGEGADVDQMRGFMAGQAGQMFENLFQRGMLPQSIGALTPAERVRAIGDEARRDDATMNRLAEEMARTELMQSTELFDGRRFDEVTEQERKTILEGRLPTYRGRVDDTMRKIDEFRNNDPRASSVEDIEKSAGFDSLARNVDGVKAANKVKEFAGAVSAVREIFGDNGNPNAPMPALLAALDQLTQGTMAQMSTGKVENTLRQMRLAAKDAGIGMEQLMGMSGEISAYGDTLGIARPISLQNTVNAALMTQAMRQAGSFDKPVFGRMDQATASREAAMRIQQGDASGVGKTLASMARAVAENPTQYAGTEVEALVSAYNNGQETYNFDGKTVNLAQLAGVGGAPALAELFTRPENKGNMATLEMFSYDQTTQRYMKPGYAVLAQRFQLQRDMANSNLGGAIMDLVDAKGFENVAAGLGIPLTDPDAERFGFGKMFASGLADVILSETGNMNPEERVDYLMKDNRVGRMLEQQFVAAGYTPDEAKRRAEASMPLVIGNTPEEQRDRLGRFLSAADVDAQAITGRSLAANAQMQSPAVQANYVRNQQRSEARSERYRAMAMGNESSLLQRVFEEVDKVSQGETFSLERVANVLSVAGMEQKYAAGIAAGLESAYGERAKLFVSKPEVDDLKARAEKGDQAAIKQLKFMTGVKDGTEVVSADDISTKLGLKSNEEINDIYKRLVDAGETDTAKQITALSTAAGIENVAGVLDPDKDQITQAQLSNLAEGTVGRVFKGSTVEEQRASRDRAREIETYTNAVYNAAGLETAAGSLATEAASARKLSEPQTKELREQYAKALQGDAAALTALEKTESTDSITRLKSLISAKTEAVKGNIMADAGFQTRFSTADDALQQQEVQKRAEEVTKQNNEIKARAAGRDPADAAQKDTPVPDATQQLASATLQASTVQLTAQAVNMNAAPAVDDVASGTRSLTPLSAVGSDGNQLVVNGTLTLDNMHRAVLEVVGDKPLETPDGPPIMNAHVYG
jgi:hypothetical protein